MVKVGVIWAQNSRGVIGAKNGIPWYLPEDLRHFSEITKHETVIMGRNTWLSLPEAYRPLPERQNIVITSSFLDTPNNVIVVSSFEEAIQQVKTEWAWVIGGGQLYESVINLATRLEVTYIDLPIIQGDVYAPNIPDIFVSSEGTNWQIAKNSIRYRFETFVKNQLE